ncbi:MAG TPA: hypothetical protein PKC15_07950 [Rhodocyclaceae bacterium]|uniref:hypothetical protein n=1 Tax=Plasticicumulans sp. TaxID=2307179 RepID=UPI002BDB0757|nr:hypothetical protein [Rhodocyclaceae bacterium]
MDLSMPWVTLADGSTVQVPVGHDGHPNWSAVGPLAAAVQSTTRTLSLIDFRRRFGDSARTRVYTAVQSSPLLRAWLDDIAAPPEVDLDDDRLVSALADLVASGVLTAEEVAAIRA